MTWTAHSCFVTLAILFLWRVEEIAEACSCSPVHPQEGFCRSDVVIRAKVVGMQEIEVGNNIYGSPITRIQYDISQIKMFKGPEPKIDAIYSAPFSSLCGITLETGKEYLITGRLEADGKVHVTLCNFFRPWEDMSTSQKKSLTQLYEMGCDCKIIYCPSAPCMISNPTECLWLDWIMEKTVNGEQSKHFACVKRSDDSCAWYRGSAPPSKDFMDIEDP